MPKPKTLAHTTILILLYTLTACDPTQNRIYEYNLNNNERTNNNQPPLHWNTQLAQQTQQWAEHLAQTQTLTHSHLTPPPGTHQITENIGYGPNTQTIHNALMQSPPHRENTLNPNATQTGIGYATNGNTTYIVEQQTTP